MKTIQFILILLTSVNLLAQSDVPDKYWINDSDFEKKISGSSQFEDGEDIVVVEFWAEFNKDNCLSLIHI